MKQLFCVKSIMTIMVTAMLCVMVYLHPSEYGELFKNVCVMIATFYFAHQQRKGELDGSGWDGSTLRGNSNTDFSEQLIKEGKKDGNNSGN